MAEMVDDVEPPSPMRERDFSVISFLHPSLVWLNHPSSWNVSDPKGELEGSQGKAYVSEFGSSLSIQPPAKKDFWSKTFYTPTLIKSDASALLGQVPLHREATVSIDFELTAVSQFDQAGLLIYIDDTHWVKCGIEYCDGVPRLSVVVCNDFSDWSTQTWPSFSARIKVHKILQSDSIVIEAAPLDTSQFQFVRIAHLNHDSLRRKLEEDPTARGWQVGPYAASPVAQRGCLAKFTDFFIGQKEHCTHHSEL